MQIHQLEQFCLLAEVLNYSTAAKILFVSQPTLSRTIMSLETEIGAPLFKRNKQNVRLSNAGVNFLPLAKKMIDDYNEAIAYIRASIDGTTGKLRIGFNSWGFRGFLPLVIPQFQATNPKVDIDAEQGYVSKLIEQLDSNKIDIALTRDYALEGYSHFEKVPLWTVPMCAVVPAGHRLASKDAIHIKDLLDERFYIVDSAVRYYPPIKPLMESKKDTLDAYKTPNIREAGNIASMLDLVASGLGVCLAHKHIRKYTKANVKFLDLLDYQDYDKNITSNYSYNATLLWRKDNLNPCTPLFIEAVKQVLPNYLQEIY